MAKASIQTRERADGTNAYRVMFRIDGRLVGETFDTIAAAETFVGWIEKFGGLEARELRRKRTGQQKATPTVTEWARTHVGQLSGITEGTRRRYLDIIDQQIEPTILGQLPVDVAERTHVASWIRDQETADAAGKTIKNRHGLLSAVFTSAIIAGLRASNPCERSRIGQTERKPPVFLTPNEFVILLTHMPERWKPITVALVGTGMRFGEAAALQVGDVQLDDNPPTVRIERAWKYVDGTSRVLGPPKTNRGRRTISLATNTVPVLRPFVEGRAADEFVFTTAGGKPVRHVDYYEDGWTKAVKRATTTHRKDGTEIPKAERLTKRPRIHDLRHTHASWLIADGRPLTEIQHRLGHESIKTTSDTYGHLAPEAHLRAATSIEHALAQALPELET